MATSLAGAERGVSTETNATANTTESKFDENDGSLSSMESDSSSTSSSSSSSSSTGSSESESLHDASGAAAAKKGNELVSDGQDPSSARDSADEQVESGEFDLNDVYRSGPDDERSARDNKSIASAVSEIDELEDEILQDDRVNTKQIIAPSGERVRRRRRKLYRDDKTPFVLEIDDETDEDLLTVLLDKQLPEGIRLCTTSTMPDFGTGAGGSMSEFSGGPMIVSMLRYTWKATTRGSK